MFALHAAGGGPPHGIIPCPILNPLKVVIGFVDKLCLVPYHVLAAVTVLAYRSSTLTSFWYCSMSPVVVLLIALFWRAPAGPL